MKLLVWLCMWSMFSQTQIDLPSQSKTVDFSGAERTKSFRIGSSLPLTCSQGETFLLIPGENNFYACVAENVWKSPIGTAFSGGEGILINGSEISLDYTTTPRYRVGSGIPSINCTLGRDFYVDTASRSLYYCEHSNIWRELNGEHSGAGSQSSTWLLSSPGVAVGSGLTVYGYVSGGHGTPFGNTAIARENVMPDGGEIKNCFIRVNGTQSSSGSLDATILVNGNPSEIEISVPSSSPTAVYSDTAHSTGVSAGDTVTWRLKNNAASNSIVVVSLACKVDPV